MSLAIDVEKVKAVLLSDGWHEIMPKSFSIDSYEFLEYPDGYDHKKGGWHQRDKFNETMTPFILHGGGNNGVCASGFWFREKVSREVVFGPLTSILAVKYEKDKLAK